MADERLAKRADNGSARIDRLSLDRPIAQDRENSESVRKAERRKLLRDTNTLLPDPPELPGYHLCWLTTTNQKDPLEFRFRRGYELVKRAELPGFCLNSQKSGEVTDDRIMVNEMVLAKIPMDLWKQDMIEIHHEIPKEQMDNLRNSVRIGQDGKGRQVAYSGGEFRDGVSDGYQSIRATPANLNLVGIR